MYKRVRNTNAWIEREGSIVRLLSYETLVCEVHKESKHIILSPAAKCSRTTIRHMSEFLREFGVSYFDAKAVLVDPSHKPVYAYDGYTISVSYDPRFKLRETKQFCMI